MTPPGTTDFTANGKGAFKPKSCNATAGSLVCTVGYSPNPGSEGTQMVNASYAGDGIVKPSSASFALTATQRNTTVIVSCKPSSLQAGATAKCNATVNDTSGIGLTVPSGQVSFSSNVTGSFSPSNCTLGFGNCSASYAPSTGSHGSALVTASYTGDTDHSASSGSSAILFGKRGSSVSIQCSPSQLSASQISTCQVMVLDTGSGTQITPTGNVVFSSSLQGNFSSTACTLVGGGCSFKYEPSPGSQGKDVLSAVYQGDIQHTSSSTSGGGSFTLIVLSRSSSTAIVCNPSNVSVNSGTICTVNVTDSGSGPSITPTGNVTFSPSTSGKFSQANCQLSAGACAFTFTPLPGTEGQISIHAAYNGDPNHSGSAASTQITSTVRSTALAISCSQAAAGSASTCTITVRDTDKGNQTALLGFVDGFSDGGWGGSFGSTRCNLTYGSCTVTYISGTGTSGIGINISATYEGDYDHASSIGSTRFTPS
ncbi:MAG TPA: hypothetical protein VGR53_08910 [Nitrososphaerales archaeon]|nr:hypothetical protein [Nitrososphaerales archaeon]